MALLQTIWVNYIRERLFPDDSFVRNSVDESQFVNYKTVYRPIAGTQPTVMLNATGEQTESKYIDTDTSYSLNNLRTKAVTVEDVDSIELSYDALASFASRHVSQLNLKGSNYMAHLWCPDKAANIIRTSGSNATSVITGTTGNRKKMTLTDFSKAVELIEDMDIDLNGVSCLMPVGWYRQLLIDEKATLLDLSKSGKATLVDGELEKLMGIRIYRRGKKNVLRYNNDATPLPVSPFATVSASENAAALFWHRECVGRAIGEIKMYDAPNAKSQGTDISARVRIGGSPIYDDLTGLAAIVESV